jgi:hypothetical protein
MLSQLHFLIVDDANFEYSNSKISALAANRAIILLLWTFGNRLIFA